MTEGGKEVQQDSGRQRERDIEGTRKSERGREGQVVKGKEERVGTLKAGKEREGEGAR